MTKLYIGIDALSGITDDLIKRSGLDPSEQNTLAMHITTQYCGKEINEEDLDKIKNIWETVMKEHEFRTDRDLSVCVTGKFDLYGLKKDVLVVLCTVSAKFTAAVEEARRRVSAEIEAVSVSDFDFSPHVTLGQATTLPESSGPPVETRFRFDRVTMWGNENEVRDTIMIRL